MLLLSGSAAATHMLLGTLHEAIYILAPWPRTLLPALHAAAARPPRSSYARRGRIVAWICEYLAPTIYSAASKAPISG